MSGRGGGRRRGRTEPGSGTSGRKAERDREKRGGWEGRGEPPLLAASRAGARTTPGVVHTNSAATAAAAHSLFIGSLPGAPLQ